jgi:V-type H+-transporting ATPase subunit a
LGELGLVQFKDLNKDVNAFQRKYVNEVRRCEEMERKLRFLETEIQRDGIKIIDNGDNPDAPVTREMSDIESHLERLENEMKEVNSNYEILKRNFGDLTELKHILSKTNHFFDESDKESLILNNDIGVPAATTVSNLGFVAGVIVRERLPAFERMLWRACRGNVLLRHTDIDQPLENPTTGVTVYKSVFLIFFQGDQLKSKVKKICEGFHGTVYPCPETQSERREMAMGVVTRIEDLKTVLNQTEEHRYRVLSDAAVRHRVWSIKVRKMKAIFHTMNMFTGGQTTAGNIAQSRALIAECWCPVQQLDKIQQALRRGTEHSGSGVSSILNMIETSESPPTYNRTNKFTDVFQGIIDSYGVATYQEINPAPFTIITFPFLFSVMFGDAGHGVIVFLFALAMVLMEKKLLQTKTDNEIWNIFFGGRYIILLMGAFSIYSGLMYNDVFSKSVNIFGSEWYPAESRYPESLLESSHDLTLDPTNNTDNNGTLYPFGVDPVWAMSLNKISFLNSFKMKISVIFGVSQMLFGVILSILNHRFNADVISIVCEFIPQMIFLLAIFGYLIILIFYKWIVYDASHAACAPSLLIQLINMFLLNYPKEPCSVVTFYTGQYTFQVILLLLVVICIPWLLVPKPFLLRAKHKKNTVLLSV